MSSSWAGPVAWAATQVVALVALTAVGLGLVGALAGTAYAIALATLLIAALRRSGRFALSAADHVTEARTMLAGLVTALVVDSFQRQVPVALLVGFAAVAIVLDAVDGRVARGTGSASAFGARFDIEADSFLALVLSVYVAVSLGPWVLAIGLMRYAFVAASYPLPWLRAPLPPSQARKIVGAAQGVVLVIAAAGVVPIAVMTAIVALALAAQVASFARDVIWLRRT